MHTHIKLIAIIVAVVVLTGCGKGGLSVGVESSTSSDAGTKSSIDKSTTVTAGRTAKASTAVPGAQLIATALRPIAAVAGINVAAYAYNVKYAGYPLIDLQKGLARHQFSASAEAQEASTPAQIDRAQTFAEQLGGQPSNDPVARYAAQQLQRCLDLVAAGDGMGGRSCLSDYYTRAYAGAAILATSAPQLTPGFSREAVVGFDKRRKFPAKELDTWLASSVALLDLSIKVQPALLRDITGRVLQSEDDARMHIAKSLMTYPVDKLVALAQRPGDLTAVVTPGDVQSPLKLVVPERNWNLSQDEKGLTLMANGGIWHGDGQIAGVKFEIALETTAGATAESKATTGTDLSDKSTATTKVGADLK